VSKKGRSTLQQTTGQGKETGGIKYPIPSVNIVAILEQEYGPLEFLLDPDVAKKIMAKRALTDDEKSRVTGVNQVRMMIWLLEMQKADREEEIEVMSHRERMVAIVTFFKEKHINIRNVKQYARAANAVFGKAPKLSRK